MQNHRFLDQVRQQLIRILALERKAARQQAATAAAAQEGTLRYGAEDVVAFVDLQNFHYFLKHNCRVPATQVHLPNLLRDFAGVHGLKLAEIYVFTGIHDPKREPHRHESMTKRLRWLERNGCKCIALPLSYYTNRETLEVKAQEKGVDVRIGSEILRAVNDGLRRCLVTTQDKDIAQALHVASEMAAERHREFAAYTPELSGAEWEHDGKCGMHGLKGTTRLAMSVDLVRKHVRLPREDSPNEDTAASEDQHA